jgi:class 3 adenylate cyclase/tetratricopeptide (TPR) repeat protein
VTSATDALQVSCQRCGEANPAHARFCHACGARLDDARPREERKLVSVLFVDLEGFTTSSDRADPEDVRDSLERYHAAAKDCIEQFGGVVEKFIGDAVMAVFGAPVAHGDDAERAVRAGLGVLERVAALGLRARAAVETGEAVVRLVDPASGQAIAMGDVVNTASRLQSHAPTGRLLAGDETHRAARHAFVFEPVAPLEVKGKREPLAAWMVGEPTADDGERGSTVVPFVGRGRELDVVRSLWEQAIGERRPQVVTVLGTPGVGKSRLCREVAGLVEADGGSVLRGRCLPYDEKTGYHAFSQIVRQLAGIFDSDATLVAHEKLAAFVEGMFDDEEAPSRTRDLALLLGLEAEETALQQRVLFFSARRLVERIGEAQPTLVVFEDVHWGAASELDLFEYLGAHVGETRVLFIALARPELVDTRPAWGAGSAAQTRISLEPLAAEVAGEMATSLLPDLDANAIDRLVEVAEGNPLFIEELAAAAAEQGGVDALPVTVRAVIAARVDSLPADARATLLSAAVVGRTFWQEVLREASGIADLDAILDDLERRNFIRREPTSRLEGDLEFRFKHALIRDVAYGTLPRATRRERHAAIARFVESRTEAEDSLAWVLAHHWREAGKPEKAVPHLLAAAAVAQRSWAKGEVIDLYSTALELAEDDGARAPILLRRAHAHNVFGEYPETLENLEPVLPRLDGADLLEGLLLAGKAYVWTERDVDALATAERALGLAVSLGDSDGEVAATALVSEALAMRAGEGDIDRALELGDDALARWRVGAREFEHADHSHIHGDLKYWVGDYERTLELGTKAHELGDHVHSIEARLRGGGLRAMALTGLGRHEEALTAVNETIAVQRELGGDGAYLRNYTSMILRELNDLANARQTSELALERALAFSFGMPRRFAQSDLLLTSLLEGDIGRAQADWPALWEDAQVAPAWTRWLIRGRLATSRAEIALSAESPETAAEWAQTAIEIAVSTRRRKYEVLARSTLGQALARLGRREESLSEHTAAVAIADGLVGQPARYSARAALAQSAYALGDDDRAASATAEARELVDGFLATLAPERAALVRASPVVRGLLDS